MPTRILRDCTDSEPVNSLTAEAERHFYRLIMKADDYGRLTANSKVLRPLLYPLLIEVIREADLDRWGAECVSASLVRFYDVGGKRFQEIIKFGQRARTPSKCPPPPDAGPPPTLPPPDVGKSLTNDRQVTASMPRNSEALAHSEAQLKAKAQTGARGFSFADADSEDPILRLEGWELSGLSDGLDTAVFKRAYAEWVLGIREQKKPFTATMNRKQISFLAGLSHNDAVAAVENSARNGYTGIFSPRQGGGTASPSPSKPIYKTIRHGEQ